MSSLPVAGVDGTLRRSKGVPGRAHLKTGSLRDVVGVAGYVLGDSGRRYVVVAIVNHPNAERGAAGARGAGASGRPTTTAPRRIAPATGRRAAPRRASVVRTGCSARADRRELAEQLLAAGAEVPVVGPEEGAAAAAGDQRQRRCSRGSTAASAATWSGRRPAWLALVKPYVPGKFADLARPASSSRTRPILRPSLMIVARSVALKLSDQPLAQHAGRSVSVCAALSARAIGREADVGDGRERCTLAPALARRLTCRPTSAAGGLDVGDQLGLADRRVLRVLRQHVVVRRPAP